MKFILFIGGYSFTALSIAGILLFFWARGCFIRFFSGWAVGGLRGREFNLVGGGLWPLCGSS